MRNTFWDDGYWVDSLIDVIGLSVGPTHLYKQKLNFGKAPLLVAQPMKLLDSSADLTII